MRLLSDVKSLVTVGEHGLRVASLVDVTVVQGTAATLRVRVPDGFELASVSGASIEVASEQPGLVDLTILPGDRRRHQFLVTIERGTPDTTRKATVPLPWLDGSQRETGEVAVEGVGALDLTLDDQPASTRIDVGEVAPALQALAREPLLAASRYHRRAPEAVTLALGIVRFPDAPVLTAVADRAVATTLVTTEGRALTEVMLTVRNQAQPFLKVGLPTGATLLSAEVGGTAVKPAHGVDGTRVPLLRPGLQTREPYRVSFIYLHTGTPFANKGDAQLSLARVDVPIAWLEWEVFLRIASRSPASVAWPSIGARRCVRQHRPRRGARGRGRPRGDRDGRDGVAPQGARQAAAGQRAVDERPEPAAPCSRHPARSHGCAARGSLPQLRPAARPRRGDRSGFKYRRR